MDSAVAPPLPPLAFTDGLGQRRAVAGTRNQPLSILLLSNDLASGPSFEAALKRGIDRMMPFQHPAFAHVRGIVHVGPDQRRLALASDLVPGTRLSEMLAAAETRLIPLEIDAAFAVISQLAEAMAAMAEAVPGACHGALSPERIIITPDARVVIAEYALAEALEGLQRSREEYWKSLRVALPASAGVAVFDARVDVTQLGAVALALIAGRLLREDEYPGRVADLVDSVRAISSTGLEPLPPEVHAWLRRALQLEARSFGSAIEAHAALDQLPFNDERAATKSLQAFLDQCGAAQAAAAAAAPAPRPSSASAIPAAARAAVPRSAAAPRSAPAVAAARESSPFPSESLAAPAAVAPPRHAVAPIPHVEDADPAPSLADATPSTTADAPMPALAHAAAPAPAIASAPVDAPMRAPTSAPVPMPSRASAVEPVTSVEAAPAFRAFEPEREAAPTSTSMPGRAPDVKAGTSVEATPAFRAFESEREATIPASSTSGVWGAAADEAVESAPPRRFDLPRRQLIAAGAALLAIASVGTLAAGGFFGGEAGGTLAVTTNPSGVDVAVDGEHRGTSPLTLYLSPGEHVLTIATAAEVRRIPVTITNGGEVAQFIELASNAPLAVEGQLQVKTEPSGAMVSVDGEQRGRSPLTIDGLSPGLHTVKLEGPLGTVTQQVTIEAGVTASLVVPLSGPAGAPVSGWIAVTAPADIQVYEDGRLLGTSRSDRIMVSAGRHQLELVNEALGFRTAHVAQVPAGEVHRIAVEWPNGVLAMNALPWAEVWLDGQRLGETPLGNVQVPIGQHNLVFRHPELGQQSHDVTVTATGVARVTADLRRR